MKKDCGDQLINSWKKKNFPVVPRDKKWAELKWHVCKANEPVNPIMRSKGGEIEVEQFGIIGWLFKVKDKTFPEKEAYFYQCPLVEARETGTGKFGEWLSNTKKFVRREFGSTLALTNIANERLYKYCAEHDVLVAVDNRLYSVKIKK